MDGDINIKNMDKFFFFQFKYLYSQNLINKIVDVIVNSFLDEIELILFYF